MRPVLRHSLLAVLLALAGVGAAQAQPWERYERHDYRPPPPPPPGYDGAFELQREALREGCVAHYAGRWDAEERIHACRRRETEHWREALRRGCYSLFGEHPHRLRACLGD